MPIKFMDCELRYIVLKCIFIHSYRAHRLNVCVCGGWKKLENDGSLEVHVLRTPIYIDTNSNTLMNL